MKKYWILIFFLLLGFNVYLLVSYKEYKIMCKHKIEEKGEHITKIKNLLQDRDRLIKGFYYSHITDDKKEIILEKLNIKRDFEGKKFLFYYDKNACGSCVQETIYYLKKIGIKIGNDKIIISSNMEGDQKTNLSGWDFKHYYMDTFYLEAENLKEPMVFVLDSSLNIDLMFMPQLFPEFVDEYFTNVIPKHFNGL